MCPERPTDSSTYYSSLLRVLCPLPTATHSHSGGYTQVASRPRNHDTHKEPCTKIGEDLFSF